MSDTTPFLAAELTEMGLMAAADPHFAERLLEALRRLSAEQASDPKSAHETNSAHPQEQPA